MMPGLPTTFCCADGWVALAVTRDSQWAAFCQAFGKPEWAREYLTNDDRRSAYLGELRPKLTALLAGVTRSDLTSAALRPVFPPVR